MGVSAVAGARGFNKLQVAHFDFCSPVREFSSAVSASICSWVIVGI